MPHEQVTGNPLCEGQPNLAQTLAASLPMLHMLDGKPLAPSVAGQVRAPSLLLHTLRDSECRVRQIVIQFVSGIAVLASNGDHGICH